MVTVIVLCTEFVSWLLSVNLPSFPRCSQCGPWKASQYDTRGYVVFVRSGGQSFNETVCVCSSQVSYAFYDEIVCEWLSQVNVNAGLVL